MKHYILMMLILFTSTAVVAQCPDYFPYKAGQIIEMESYSPKDKLESRSVQKVSRIEGNTIYMEGEVFDKKGKSVGTMAYDIICEDDKVRINMSNFMSPETMEAYKDMEVTYDAKYLELPKKLVPGTELNDESMEMEIGQNGTTLMTFKIDVTNRKIESEEEVTTPMGKVKAFKITSDHSSKLGFITVKGKSADWYANDKGLVRSETYDKNGKLTGYTVRVK